jgi:hypothetical protein
MIKVADNVVQKYQQELCQQPMAQRHQPKSPQQQRVLQLLCDDPSMRRVFIDRIAAPIVNKMFDCGMIP